MSDRIFEEFEQRFLLQEEYGGNNKPVNQIIPLVSVTVTAYQHANYIKNCLDSILMQNTEFPYEILIGEDGSTDGTREICIQYAEKHPDRIRLFMRDRATTHYKMEDRSLRFNGMFTRKAARGKYSAICEGDDYWIDPNKLSKQVEFMENHETYAACFHNAFIIDENISNNVDCFNIPAGQDTFTTKSLFENLWFVPTASIFYKTKALHVRFPDWYLRAHNGDLAILLMLSKEGPLGLLKGYLSVYRRNSLNSQSLQVKGNPDYFILRLIELLQNADLYFDKVYEKEATHMCMILKKQVFKIRIKKIIQNAFTSFKIK
jgi:glycosyltransferase involved in cell wall biosynthesis